MSLLLTWVLYAAIATGFLSAVFVWAVRSGQFGDQDRARSLPLFEGDAGRTGPRPPQAPRMSGRGGGAELTERKGER